MIQGGLTLYKLLIGDFFIFFCKLKFDSRAAHSHPTQPSGVREQAGHERARAEIDDTLLVRMILVLKMSEIDERVINCEVDNDIELFSLLWKLESRFCVELEVLYFKFGVHEVLLGGFDGFEW